MTQTIDQKTCEDCGTTEGYIGECHFCDRLVCSKHASYISVKQTSVNGVFFNTIRICRDCKPSDRI